MCGHSVLKFHPGQTATGLFEPQRPAPYIAVERFKIIKLVSYLIEVM
jgi:hypothetical protein